MFARRRCSFCHRWFYPHSRLKQRQKTESSWRGTHHGLVYVLVIGTPDRFPCGKQLGSYTGLIPCEDSSAGKQRLGHISKQGNKLLRYLLGEAAQAAARCNPDWRRRYVHLMMRRQKKIAKVAMARKLAVRLYWMWRNNWQYSQLVEYGSNAGKLGIVHGVK
jgi:transposase